MTSRQATERDSIKRECGGCTACCTVMAVRALDKPVGVPCQHLVRLTVNGKRGGGDEVIGGCGIYHRRPDSCAGFVCVWLRDTIHLLSEDERPDRIGLVLTASEPDVQGRQSMEIRELFRGASRTRRAQELISRIAKLVDIRVVTAPEPHPQVVVRANNFLKDRRATARDCCRKTSSR